MKIKLLITIVIVIILLTVGLEVATTCISDSNTVNNVLGILYIIGICYAIIKIIINLIKKTVKK